MITIGQKMLIVKEHAIYEMMQADYVDPDRTNINIPNTIQKRIVDKGSESPVVARVFLTAKTLFRNQFFNDTVDVQKALLLSLDLLKEVMSLESEIEQYLAKENEVSERYEKERNAQASYALPFIGDVEKRCEKFFQNADHIE
jgi:hypothetical protein